jgi:hypothetical protein
MHSRLVMHGESSAARAAALASDWYRLGRCRSLGELAGEVEAVCIDRLNDWIEGEMNAAWRGRMTACTVGRQPLKISAALGA